MKMKRKNRITAPNTGFALVVTPFKHKKEQKN